MSGPWDDYPPLATQSGPWEDYAAPPSGNALSGAARALETNLPFADRAVAGLKTILPQGYGGTGQDYAANFAAERAKNAQFEQQNPATSAIGGVAASAPLLAFGGPAFGLGGMAGEMASSAAPFALASALQGASSSPDLTNLPETGERAGIGGAVGGVVGAAAPAVASGIGKAISPFIVSPERQALVEALRQAGINPTAGQVTGSKSLQKLEAAASDIPLRLGGGDAEVSREANSRAFTAALMEKAGALPGQIATPENLNAVHEALGNQFSALGARNSIAIDPQLRADIDKVVSGYHDVTGTPAPGVAKMAKGFFNPSKSAIQEEIPFEIARPPRVAEPTPMLDVMRNYGLQDEGGDLASMGFANKNGIAAKGSFKVIDKAGIPMDEGLRIAQELGYMEPHETVADFINKLGDHPTYSRADQGAVAARADRHAYDFGSPSGELGNEANYIPPGESDMFPGDRLSAEPASISGVKYNNVRSQLGKQAQALRFSDPAQAQAYRGMQAALDDAMERSIAANNPGDVGAFQDVRAKYGNLASIEKAAGSAGADAAQGIISPAQMRTALASGNNRRAYARGIGDMAPLTNAGNAILTNFPQSGTAPRILAAHLLGAGVGGGVGYHEGGLPGALAGIAVPAVAARALMSRPIQSILANQLMRGPAAVSGVNRGAIAAALAARQQLQQRENTGQ